VHAREGLDVDQRLRRYYLFKKIEAGSAKWFITVPPPISGVVHKVAIHPAARRWFTHQSFLLCRGKSPPDTLPLVPSNCQRRQDVQCYLGLTYSKDKHDIA